jgi:biopolymer transport protein ExbD
MLLFFFMVTTVMREQELKVKVSPPAASEIQKLEKKALVDYINIGPPIEERLGTLPRIQLDDAFASVDEIGPWIEENREARNEAERPLITTSLKVDKETKMGIVTDVKQELREYMSLKINYSTSERKRR